MTLLQITASDIYLLIISALITASLSFVGYVIKTFRDEVKALAETMELLRIDYANIHTACGEKHTSINARLRGHDTDIKGLHEKVHEHDTEIMVIKKTIEK